MSVLEKLKSQPKTKITRSDIAELLQEIGEPGEKQAEKSAAVAELMLTNFQGIKLDENLTDFEEF